MANTPKTGYVNGSDLLLTVGGKAIGHCTTHTTTFASETKDRAVKPPIANTSLTAGLWKNKGMSGVSVSITFSGLMVYDETEGALKSLLDLWKTGQPVTVTCVERGENAAPYVTGEFIISQLEAVAAAQDDVTYSGTLDNAGEVTIDTTKLTNGVSTL